MSFNGLLNKTCNFQKKTLTENASGQEVESWTTIFTNIKCRLDTAHGGKTSISQLEYEKVTHVLFIRIISGFNLTTGDYRVVIDNKNYEIILIADAGGHNHHLQLGLQKVK